MAGQVIHKQGSAIKAVDRGNGLIEGYLVVYGNPKFTDLEGEFFTPKTEFRLDWYGGNLPVLYHHGLDDAVSLDPIGRVKSLREDNIGLWVQAQLDLNERYAKEVYGMVQSRPFGWSSGSIDHLVQISKDGQIKRWPLAEGSVTPAPAQPAGTTVRALKTLLKGYPLPDFDSADLPLKERRIFAKVSVPSAASLFDSYGGMKTMALLQNSASWAKVARRVLKARGIRASEEDVNAIAADLEDEYGPATMADDDFDPAMMDDQDDFGMMDDQSDFDPSMMDDQDDFGMMDDQSDFDPSMMDDQDEFAQMDDVDDFATESMSNSVGRSRRSRVRSQRARSYRDSFPNADDDSYASRSAMRGDEDMLDDAVQSRRSRSSRGRKSLEDRVRALELMEAPGQSMVGLVSRGRSTSKSFDGLRVTRDEGDQPGRYANAFKTYLRGGMDMLDRRDKQILVGKGKRDWGGADSAAIKSGDSFRIDAAKALNTSNAGSVGFAVPEDWITELNKNLMAQTVMAADAKVRQTNSDTILQPDLTTTDARRAYAANVAWPGESPSSPTEFDATEIALGQIQVPIHVMLIRMTQTNSALEDVAFDLQAEITEAFSEATAVAYDTLIWSGNGQGKMRGIVTDTRVNANASTSVSTVGGYVAAGSTTAIVSGDKLKQMFTNLPAGYRARAKWYCNSDTLLMISEMKDGIGRYLWGDERGLNGGLVDSLMGRPVVVNEFADFATSGNFPLIFGDLSRAYLIGKRVEFSVRRFDDSQYAEKDQVLFLGRARLGGQVVQPAALKLLKMSTS